MTTDQKDFKISQKYTIIGRKKNMEATEFDN